MSLDARIRRRLDALDAQGLRRALPRVRARQGVRYRLADRDVVGFCSNDYLGLADAVPTVAAPSGAASSRLICGDLDLHRRVETRLAGLSGHEDAVLFPSGFQLNVGVLPALLSSGDIVYSDQLNHASLIDGLRLSPVRAAILPHAEPPPAPAVPAGTQAAHWWVTESIFSMDGDALDPEALRLAQDRGLQTYVDDAHATGLFPGGAGWATHHGLQPTVLVGTLSKGFGCAGAFVAASSTVCEWIRTRARSFVFSTGVSPRVVGAIDAALDIVLGDEGDRRRARFRQNTAHLASLLHTQPVPGSAIFPVVLGENRTALRVAEQLLNEGWHVQAIRPPTVPDGTARLRITVTAGHDAAQIEGLVAALRRAVGPRALLQSPAARPRL